MTSSRKQQGPTTPILTLRGAALIPDRGGVLYWPDEDTLVVSDLHFEKGTAYDRRGLTLPPYDTRTTLTRLADVLARIRPGRVIALGDSFHDEEAETRMGEEDATALEALCASNEWIWILGNHDPVPPKRFGGIVAEEISIGVLTFRHEPADGADAGEVIGHFHPSAKVARHGRSVRRKCFASDGRRLILPSFGAYTGGLNVLDAALLSVLDRPFRVWMVGRTAVYPIHSRQLIPDATEQVAKARSA